MAGPGPALVVLAAGASRRLGECKALVTLVERTVLEHLLDAGGGLAAARPLVVTGADHEAISAAVLARALSCEVLENPDWTLGRTGGVRLAAAARAGLDLCLAPVDTPLVPREVFAALIEKWEQAGAPPRGWLAPCFEDSYDGEPERSSRRFGHPVLIGRELVRELERFAHDRPLRDLRERADPLLALPVDAREILDDLDTPLDLERLRRRIHRI